MSFDPNAHMPPPARSEESLTTPGKYLVAFVHVKRANRGERGTSIFQETENGNPYVTFKAVVIAGNPSGQKGRTFWPDVFLSTGAYKRLASMMRAIGYVQRIDLESEPDIKQAFLYRPFVAKVTTRRHNDRVYASISFTEEMLPEYESVAKQWIATEAPKWRERAEQASHAGTGVRDGSAGTFPQEDDPGPDDDDQIPF